jgi:hypothetical protein
MQLRPQTSSPSVEIPLILVLLVCILIAGVIVLMRRQTHDVVICTPRFKATNSNNNANIDSISICIQFTPQHAGLVQRFRAPSALDLGPAATATAAEAAEAEVKKDV